MSLLNDVRFYLMIAIAALFLIVVGMCSSAYDSDPDGHASSGVSHSDTVSTEGEASAEDEQVASTETQNDASAADATDNTETDNMATDGTVQAVAATETEATDAAVSTDAALAAEDEAAQADAMESTSEPAGTMEAKAFTLSELANTGEKVPDLTTDIGNLKSDIARYGDRINEVTGMINKVEQ